MPGTRTMFSPSPTASSSAARSPGVHTAPRQKTRTPLTQRSRDVRGPVLDGPEPDPPDHLAVDRHVVEPRRAVGVRPPELDVGELEAFAAVDLDHAGRSLDPGLQPRADPRAGDQRDRAVGPDHRRPGREAGRPAQQLGAHPAQLRLLDQHGPPALPRLGRQGVEQLGERVHDDPHLVVTGRRSAPRAARTSTGRTGRPRRRPAGPRPWRCRRPRGRPALVGRAVRDELVA